jgi:hypothetical protein
MNHCVHESLQGGIQLVISVFRIRVLDVSDNVIEELEKKQRIERIRPSNKNKRRKNREEKERGKSPMSEAPYPCIEITGKTTRAP